MEVNSPAGQLPHLALNPEKAPTVVDYQIVPLEVVER
jgi:hypothetical protein